MINSTETAVVEKLKLELKNDDVDMETCEFCLEGEVPYGNNSFVLLKNEESSYEVYFAERGHKYDLKIFQDISSASKYFQVLASGREDN